MPDATHGLAAHASDVDYKRAAEVQAQTKGAGYFKHLRKLQNVVVNQNGPAPRRRAYWKAKWYEADG